MMTPRGGPRVHAGPPITRWSRLQPGKRCRLALPDGVTIAGEVLQVRTIVTIRSADGAVITVTHSAPPDPCTPDLDKEKGV